MEKGLLVKRFAKLFCKSEDDCRNISAAEAISLQQEYIAESREAKEVSLQAYLSIVTQLNDNHDEISAAALTYLQKIAANLPQYAEDIVMILEARLKQIRGEKRLKAPLMHAISAIKADLQKNN